MTRITKERIDVDGAAVFVVRMAPPGEPRGSVFAPPLIGGSGLQQYHYFKRINRAGYELISFDYRGHGKSEGRFSVRNTIEDTCAVVRQVRHDLEGRDVYGLGDCYGAIPLLHAVRDYPAVFSAVALFNPMPSLQYLAGPWTVLRNYFMPGGRPRLRNPFDLKGLLAATNERLFPDVDKSRDHFGILHYDRARRLRSAWEYFTYNPLTRLAPQRIPALVVYGRSDSVLGLDRPENEEDYRRSLSRILPHARFRALADVDHYWTDTKRLANAEALEFFSRLGPRRGVPRRVAKRGRELLTPSWSR